MATGAELTTQEKQAHMDPFLLALANLVSDVADADADNFSKRESWFSMIRARRLLQDIDAESIGIKVSPVNRHAR